MISLFGHEFSDSAQATRAKAQDVFLEFSYSSCFKCFYHLKSAFSENLASI